jgi:hypothetical protein
VEPRSILLRNNSSYIHLEYEYAIEQKKPLFAVVIDDNYLKEKVKKLGPEAIETENTPKFRGFRDFVRTRAYSTAKLPPIPGESCH